MSDYIYYLMVYILKLKSKEKRPTERKNSFYNLENNKFLNFNQKTIEKNMISNTKYKINH